MTNVTFQPINDQVLLKMDIQPSSPLDIHAKDRPTILPSGIVIAVGKGVFTPGVGWIEPQVKEGDHVAVTLDGPFMNLPLSPEKNEIFITISESLILGKLGGADFGSCWFKAAEASTNNAAAAAAISRITGRR